MPGTKRTYGDFIGINDNIFSNEFDFLDDLIDINDIDINDIDINDLKDDTIPPEVQQTPETEEEKTSIFDFKNSYFINGSFKKTGVKLVNDGHIIDVLEEIKINDTEKIVIIKYYKK